MNIHEVMFAAQGAELAINDRVRLYKFETELRADVSAIGVPGTSVRTKIGVEAEVGNVFSQLDVELRSRGGVYGDLFTSGALIPQSPYTITGNMQQGVTLSPHEVTQFAYRFPSNMVPMGTVDQNKTLAPGGYGSTTVQNGGILRLSAGSYYFEDLLVNSAGTLMLDSTSGPIFVVVRGEFHKHGTFLYTTGYQNVAFIPVADDFVPIVGEFAGTLIAPNAAVELSTTTPSSVVQRIGAMIGLSITAQPATTYRISTFDREDCDTACGIMWGCEGKDPYVPCEGEPPICAPNCEPGVECEDDSWCKGDCGDKNGVHFAQTGADLCWGDEDIPVVCSDTEDFLDNCGDGASLCGACLDGPCEGDDCLLPCRTPSEPGCEHCYDGVLNVDEWQPDCGPSCPNQNCLVPSSPCENDAECGDGAICSDLAPMALGLQDQTQSVCWNDECASGLTKCGTPMA